MRMAQSETFYPSFQEGSSAATAVAVGIIRLTDGLWLDWDDTTFKNVGWTTQYQDMAEDSDGHWTYTTGFAIPDANAAYSVIYKFTVGGQAYYQKGEYIVVNATVLPNDIASTVNAQVSDVIKTDTISELSAGAPDAEPTLENAIMLLYMALRNKEDQTSSEYQVHNNAGTVVCEADLTDDGTTASKSKLRAA